VTFNAWNIDRISGDIEVEVVEIRYNLTSVRLPEQEQVLQIFD
jgi:hypothetical protein